MDRDNIYITVYMGDKPRCESLGRNGYAITRGISCFTWRDGLVCINPITSRYLLQVCHIELTEDAMDKMCIEWLQKKGMRVS